MTEKARKTASAVSTLRPDFESDSIAVTLMGDPDLTIDEVIEILDQATADYSADCAAEVGE